MFVSCINQTIDSEHVLRCPGMSPGEQKTASGREKMERGEDGGRQLRKKEKKQKKKGNNAAWCDKTWWLLTTWKTHGIFFVGRHICCYHWSYQVSGYEVASVCALTVFWGVVLLHFSQQADRVMKRCWPTYCAHTLLSLSMSNHLSSLALSNFISAITHFFLVML